MEVVQNLSLDGAASTMVLEEDEGKSYLQIHFAGGQEAWVNVSQPEKPLATSPSNPAERNQVNQDLVMVHTAANQEPNQPASTELSLWDISKAKAPRLVGKFSAVSRVIADPRGYIYVLHRDGLTVIRSKAKKDNDNGPDYGIFG
jgi:hypothetical protein